MVSASEAGDKHLPSGSTCMLRKEVEEGKSLLNDSETEEVGRTLLNERE